MVFHLPCNLSFTKKSRIFLSFIFRGDAKWGHKPLYFLSKSKQSLKEKLTEITTCYLSKYLKCVIVHIFQHYIKYFKNDTTLIKSIECFQKELIVKSFSLNKNLVLGWIFGAACNFSNFKRFCMLHLKNTNCPSKPLKTVGEWC